MLAFDEFDATDGHFVVRVDQTEFKAAVWMDKHAAQRGVGFYNRHDVARLVRSEVVKPTLPVVPAPISSSDAGKTTL